MDKLEDGGPAFPQHPSQDDVANFGGMTLRDYFAAQALDIARYDEDGGHQLIERVAERAYLIADAMLAERAK